MTLSAKEKIIHYITDYFHTHPHDVKVSHFFQTINQINDESTLTILRNRLKKSVHTIAIHRLEQNKVPTKNNNIKNKQKDEHEADALLNNLGI